MRVIGIDPGLRRTGWGVIEADGVRLRHLGSGTLLSGEGTLAQRLCRLHDALAEVVARFAPDEAAVEETFVSRDGSATLKLGQARGIALLVPARAGLPVAEYAPNTVKKTVVGTGHAQKEQVGHMVRMQLPGAQPQGADAADALAIAICHAHHATTRRRYAAALAERSEASAPSGDGSRAGRRPAAGQGAARARKAGPAVPAGEGLAGEGLAGEGLAGEGAR